MEVMWFHIFDRFRVTPNDLDVVVEPIVVFFLDTSAPKYIVCQLLPILLLQILEVSSHVVD